MQGITVKQAGLADVETLAPLFDSYRQFYGRESDIQAALSFLIERFGHSESTLFIAYKDEMPVGFTQLYPSFSSVSLARTYILNDLYVNADVRREGVAKALIYAAKNYAKTVGAIRLTLSTAIDNINAQNAYESIGWQKDNNFYVYHLQIA